jgi:hypothetical protein
MSKVSWLQVGAMVVGLSLAPAASAATELLAGVGGTEITLKQRLAIGDTAVSSIPYGSYTFVVRDRSKVNNFHLFGPGVDKKTSRAFVGKQTWTLRLRKGVYTFRSDTAPRALKKNFRVT